MTIQIIYSRIYGTAWETHYTLNALKRALKLATNTVMSQRQIYCRSVLKIIGSVRPVIKQWPLWTTEQTPWSEIYHRHHGYELKQLELEWPIRNLKWSPLVPLWQVLSTFCSIKWRVEWTKWLLSPHSYSPDRAHSTSYLKTRIVRKRKVSGLWSEDSVTILRLMILGIKWQFQWCFKHWEKM